MRAREWQLELVIDCIVHRFIWLGQYHYEMSCRRLYYIWGVLASECMLGHWELLVRPQSCVSVEGHQLAAIVLMIFSGNEVFKLTLIHIHLVAFCPSNSILWHLQVELGILSFLHDCLILTVISVRGNPPGIYTRPSKNHKRKILS